MTESDGMQELVVRSMHGLKKKEFQAPNHVKILRMYYQAFAYPKSLKILLLKKTGKFNHLLSI